MLKLLKKHRFAIVAIGCVLAVLWLSFSSESFQSCIENKQNVDAEKAFYESISHFLISLGVLRGCTSYFIHEAGDAITVLATLLIAIFTWTLWRSTDRAGEHFRVSERAYVKLSQTPPGLRWEGNTGKFNIALKITNHGHTPARVTDVVTNFFLPPLGMRINELPPYVRHNFIKETKAFLVKDDCVFQHISLSVEPAEQASLIAGSVKMIFFGYADYIDVFGVRHRAGYGRQYLPTATENNLVFPNEGPFNYDRERIRGEGTDWD